MPPSHSDHAKTVREGLSLVRKYVSEDGAARLARALDAMEREYDRASREAASYAIDGDDERTKNGAAVAAALVPHAEQCGADCRRCMAEGAIGRMEAWDRVGRMIVGALTPIRQENDALRRKVEELESRHVCDHRCNSDGHHAWPSPGTEERT